MPYHHSGGPCGPRSTRRTFLRVLAGAGVVSAGVGLVGCGAATDRVVAMDDGMTFVPANLVVKLGESVTWRNQSGSMVHTVTTDAAKVLDPANVHLPRGGAAWDSGSIAPGQSWSHTFATPGEYRYCCLPHELVGMVGTVTVEDA